MERVLYDGTGFLQVAKKLPARLRQKQSLIQRACVSSV